MIHNIYYNLEKDFVKLPAYQLSMFIRDCSIGVSKAYASKSAVETARSDFNLGTQERILGFIGNGGIESPCLSNSNLWNNNPNPDQPIMVDSYDFFSGVTYGYLAFFYQPETKKWIIKSLKKNNKTDIRNLAFKRALNKLSQN